MVKATKGRQKIQMEKMKNESNLQVTFSKRRTGLFKKASELSTLCGVDIAVIVFSPGGKAYSFGHPSVEAITDRFLSNNHNNPQQQHLPSGTIQLIEASRNNTVRELNFQLAQVTEQLELEKIRGEQLNRALEACGGGHPTVEEMNLFQLQEFRLQLESLKIKIAKQAEETSLQNLNPHSQLLFNNNNAPLSSSLSIMPPPQLHLHHQQHQQQPWSALPQLQYPSLVSPPSLGVGVGVGVGVGPSSSSSSVFQPLSQLSTSVVNVAPQHFWGNLASSSGSSSSSMPMPQVQLLGQVDARNDDQYNNPGTGGVMMMQPPRNLGMMNFGSGLGSSSGSGGLGGGGL